MIEGATSAEIFFGADGRVVIETDNDMRKVLEGSYSQADLDGATMTVEDGALTIFIGDGFSEVSGDNKFAEIAQDDAFGLLEMKMLTSTLFQGWTSIRKIWRL